MISFLTSSAYDEFEQINPKNDFLVNLRSFWNFKANVLYIASFPDAYDITDEYANKHHQAYLDAGLSINNFNVLDYRNINDASKLIKEADVIILCGGHCPTEMKFFNELKLKDRLKDFDGIIISTSAGSMNAADVVYAQPELEGETDKDYIKYFEGLGLTDINILPHYHEYKDHVLDGLRVFEDITYKDSYNKCFYCFPDGTYLLIENNNSKIYGEFYIVKDGTLQKIQNDGEIYILDK